MRRCLSFSLSRNACSNARVCAHERFSPMNETLSHLLQSACDQVINLPRYLPAENQGAPKIIAHRGAWDGGDCLENSVDAFKRAAKLGAWGIEFDLHFTAANEP